MISERNNLSNIPLTVLTEVNNVEKYGVTGEYKKHRVLTVIKGIIDDNVDMEKLVSDLIELLIDISKKNIKLAINKTKRLCI